MDHHLQNDILTHHTRTLQHSLDIKTISMNGLQSNSVWLSDFKYGTIDILENPPMRFSRDQTTGSDCPRATGGDGRNVVIDKL